MTSFRVRKCLLGVPITIFYIWTLKFPKTAIWGQILTGQFFATENRFNMGILKYKLPLIVIVAE